MTIPLTLFSLLIVAALVMCAGAPILLLLFLFGDWKHGRLW